MREAKAAFEHLARELDDLWQKDILTLEEERRVQLILNNAMVIQDMLDGKDAEEFDE